MKKYPKVNLAIFSQIGRTYASLSLLLAFFLSGCADGDFKTTWTGTPTLNEKECRLNPIYPGCAEFLRNIDSGPLVITSVSFTSTQGRGVLVISGEEFDEDTKVIFEEKELPIYRSSRKEISAMIPELGDPGDKSAKVIRRKEVKEFRFNLSADHKKSDAENCTQDGQIHCITSQEFVSMSVNQAANSIVVGKTLGGIAGSLTLPAPEYVRAIAGSYGDPSAATVPTLANCAADGAHGCVVVGPSFKAAAISEDTAPKILSGQVVAGVSGTLSLPSPSKVLVGTSFGVGGNGSSGSLTLPLAASVKAGSAPFGEIGSLITPSYSPDFPLASNVRASDTTDGAAGTLVDCTAGNQSGCVSTATFRSMDLSAASATTDLTASNFNASLASASHFEFWDSTGARHQASGTTSLAAANILTGTTLFSVAGSATPAPANCSAAGAQSCVATGSYFAGTACTANGSACYLPSYVASTQPLKAISYDAIDAGKASVRSNLTLGGVAGTLADCTDAGSGCYVVGPNFKAAAVAVGTGDKIVFGETVAGVNGTVVLPVANKVLSPTAFGIGGTGITGSLTLPAASDVLSGSGTYGNPLAAMTPTLTLPAGNKVLTGTSFGTSGTGSSGSLTLPSAASVLAGSGVFGDSASQMTPSYVCPAYTRPQAPTLAAPTFSYGPDSVTLSWGSVSGSSGYIVIMRANSAVTFSPTDGVSYSTGAQGSDTVIYAGTGTTVTYPTTLSTAVTYYFAAYAYIANNIWSAVPSTKSLSSCGNLPGSWVGVPADAEYGTSAFCVMTYEAKNVSNVATSQASGTPWVNINQTAAQAACTGLGAGYDLISNNDWMALASNIANTGSNWSGTTVGSGAMNRGHSDNSPGSACAASSDNSYAYVQTDCTPLNSGSWDQKRTHTLSTGAVIWDVAGNVWDWTSASGLTTKPYVSADGSPQNDWREQSAVNAGFTSMALTQLRPTNALKSWWSDSWSSTQGIGQYYAGSSGSGGALLRGASWGDGSSAGVFSANLCCSPSNSDTVVGFRCLARAP